MKIIPIITAALVTGALYLLIFERDRLFQFAQEPATATEATEVAQEPAANPPEVEAMDEPMAQIVKVVALASEARTIESAVVLRGRTEAARQVTVAAETAGLVISEPLRKGAQVNAGDMMCQLDPGTREASLAEAEARLAEARGRVPESEAAVVEANARIAEAEINVKAARQLSEGGFASETRLVSAEAAAEAAQAGLQRANTGLASAAAGIQAAEAAVASAQREIDRLTIAAPFAGLLETDSAELGSLMQPGSPCATIIQLDPIKLVGFVPEDNVSKIELGALAGARLTDGREVQGTVTFLSRSADEVTRTFRVEVEVANRDLSIRDGQTADILISSAGRTAHLIPQSALTLDDQGALGVRIIDDANTAQFREITLLRDTVEGVWITDLPETVNIITVGQEYVTDGVPVEPTYSEAEG